MQLLLLLLHTVYALPDSFFSLVIDAGSKGTRMLIYEVKGSNENDGSFNTTVMPKCIAVKAVHHGLSFFALEPERIKPILDELIDFAKHHLSDLKSRWSSYPIYLKGTAGLRDLLPKLRDGVMSEVQHVLERSGFYFHKRQATVISGEEEAAFAWLTLNTIRQSMALQVT